MARLLMWRVVAALALFLLLAIPSSASAGWTRYASEHFLFIGDVSKGDLQRTATRLELFRDAITRIFPAPHDGPGGRYTAPTIVLVFKNDRSFAPFRPEYEGRPVQVAGYATSSEDTNYIAVNAAHQRDAYGLIFHEYTHLYMREAVGELPLWLNEGLAELYETFEAERAGRTAVVGIAGTENLALLTSDLAPISLSQLTSLDTESALYNEGDRRGLFYAQSWALAHYLMFGGPERSAQLHELLALAARGVAPSEAFARVFGSDASTLERELAVYVRRPTFAAQRLDIGEESRSRVFKGEPLADAEAAAYLGDAMAHLGRIDAARAFLTRAIESGRAPRAIAALGLLEMREGRLDVGQALLERAVSQAPELAAAQRWLGRAWLQRAARADDDAAPAFYADARLALEWSLELEPGHPVAMVALARAELGLGKPERAAELMKALVDVAPARDDYRLMLAEALLAQQDYTGAMKFLGPLLARARNAQTREAARELLSRLATARGAEQ